VVEPEVVIVPTTFPRVFVVHRGEQHVTRLKSAGVGAAADGDVVFTT
jgi:hypothetical protein